jgi:hypothetical protein
LGSVKDCKDLNASTFDSVWQKIWRPGNDEFASAGMTTRTAETGIRGKAIGGRDYSVRDGVCGLRFV